MTLEEAAHEMLDDDLGFLPIGENEKLIGVITDRDIAIRGVAEGKDPQTTPVRDVMTDKVLYCYEKDDIKTAAKSMKEQQIRRLIVLDKDKKLTGVLTMGDIATKCNDEHLCAEVVGSVCEKTHH